MAETVIPRSRSSEGRDRESAREPRRTRSREAAPYAAKHAAKPAARERQMDVRAEPKVKPAPRVRKHISALRAEERATARSAQTSRASRDGRSRAGGRSMSSAFGLLALVAGRKKKDRQSGPVRANPLPGVAVGSRIRATNAAPGKDRAGGAIAREIYERREGKPSHAKNWERAESPKGKTSRGHASGGRPAPRGQGPRTPRKK